MTTISIAERLMTEFIDSQNYMRMKELEELFESDILIDVEDIAELYYLRDLNLKLDFNDQIKWALKKLENISKKPLRKDLLIFIESDDVYEFYKNCTLDELYCLGY